MAEYTLHCFAQSGNAYKAALMLAVSDADWEPRFVDFFHGATKTPEYRAMNVMGEVPLLEHRGRILSQSGVILDYLTETLGRFGPQDNEERREIHAARNEMLPIPADHLRWLKLISKTHDTCLATDSELPILARFLDNRLVLNYRNGKDWYDIHPLLREVVDAYREDGSQP